MPSSNTGKRFLYFLKENIKKEIPLDSQNKSYGFLNKTFPHIINKIEKYLINYVPEGESFSFRLNKAKRSLISEKSIKKQDESRRVLFSNREE